MARLSKGRFQLCSAALAVLVVSGVCAWQLGGCIPSKASACESDSDCFVGEQCRDGVCHAIPNVDDSDVTSQNRDGRSQTGADTGDGGTNSADTGPNDVASDLDSGLTVDSDSDEPNGTDADTDDTIDTDVGLSEPEAGAGAEIWSHDFSRGMPTSFEHTADYPNSGTWGRAHEIDGGAVYEPANLDGDVLVLEGPACSYTGTAYPTHLDSDLQNWELHYRVDANPGSDGHASRFTGGIGAVGGVPQDSYEDDMTELKRGRTGFRDQGDTFEIEGWNADGQPETVRAGTGGLSVADGQWYVRIATSRTRKKTWVKYWAADETEPSGWTHQFDVYLDGRPGFYVQGSCKPSAPPRTNSYRFYELREIGF